jgi:hypothetical protein
VVLKSAAKKVAPKKSTAKRKPAKKTASRKASATKATAENAAARKASTKKTVSMGKPASRQLTTGSAAGVRWDPEVRAQRVNEITGSARRAAELIGVDVAQTSRWASGESVPDPERARLLLDVEYVLSFALTVWSTPEVARDWLETPNAHLDGIAPNRWIKLHGTAEVVDALRAEASGAYA